MVRKTFFTDLCDQKILSYIRSIFFRSKLCLHDLKLILSQHRPIPENISHSQLQNPRIEWVQLRVSGQIMKRSHRSRQKVITQSILQCRSEAFFFSKCKREMEGSRRSCFTPSLLKAFLQNSQPSVISELLNIG